MKTKTIFSVVALTLALSASCSFANPINILLSTDPNPSSDGQGEIESWLATVVSDYGGGLKPPGAEDFRINKGDSVSGLPSGYESFGDNTTSITLPEDYTYIVMHWGGSAKDKDNYSVYYLGDDSFGTLFTLDSPNGKGLSWYDGYAPRTIPDNGTTVALLSLALTSLAMLRRKIG